MLRPTRWHLKRRTLLTGVAAGLSLPAYGFAVEPAWRLDVTEYRPAVPRWPSDVPLTVAAIADLHVGEPYMGVARLRAIVARTNALRPDLVVLLGDYAASHRFVSRAVEPRAAAAELARLEAPLGRFAILGNHDYWDGAQPWREALGAAGIPLLENRAVRLAHGGGGFWLVGTASMLAYRLGRGRFRGRDNLPRALRMVTDDAPAILLAHEPDIFPQVPGDRIALTLCGHTHGGQVRLLGWSPVVPSRYGNRYAYGHVVEDGREMIVSAGLGVSMMPLRFGVPPEIVLVRLGAGGGTVQPRNVDAAAAGLRPSRA